ncbi:MAG: hypothetical protein H6584_02380 [Flavobacteriales bacterium]|nr:hypothetical protein [Flavobacteriales bacterium]
MACTNCSTSNGDAPKGCKSNGTCGTDSCNKLTVFDWLANMKSPDGNTTFECVEVRFKNGRKEFFRNPEKLTLSIGDVVATEAQSGHDVGVVTLTGELVKIQMKKKKVKEDAPEVLKIYRKASQKDIDTWQEARNREESIKVRAREIALALKLEMKISDIEFQGDGSKASFYYTSDERVDFRQLIKEFAKEFNIRIDMKQIGSRQEASRLGGVGSCGRELCCSTWLTDFRSVNTSAARYQQLSLNPQKLAGQCGKLKCCLNYELDSYQDALKNFPSTDTKFITEKGEAFCHKIDIFKGLMWFSYKGDFSSWHTLKTEDVHKMIQMVKEKKSISSLEEFSLDNSNEPEKSFTNAVAEDSLTRFDKPKTKKKQKSRQRNNKAKNNDNSTSGNTADGNKKEATQSKGKNNRNNKPRNKNKSATPKQN